MIVRQWHGWTSKGRAAEYEQLFRNHGPNAQHIEGRIGAFLLRREIGDEVEFTVQHLFDSMDAVRAIHGDDYTLARLIPGAEMLLSRYDAFCSHHEIVDMPASLTGRAP